MRILLLLCFVMLQCFVFAQSECEVALVKCEKLYEKAMYEEVISTLTKRLSSCAYSKEEKKKIYKLLTGAHYAIDDLKSTDKYARKFLKKDPNYKLNTEADNYEFTQTVRKYTVTPKLGVSVSLNYTQFDFDQGRVNTVWNGADYSLPYEVNHSFNALSVDIQWYFNRSLWFSTGYNQLPINFSRSIPLQDESSISYSEKTNGWAIPIKLNCKFLEYRNFYPSVFIGVSLVGFFSPKVNITTPYGAIEEQSSSDLIDYDMSKYRNTSNLAFNTGVRLHYKYNNYIFFAEYQYWNFALPYTNGIINWELLSDYYYADNELKISAKTVSIGVTYVLRYRIKNLFVPKR